MVWNWIEQTAVNVVIYSEQVFWFTSGLVVGILIVSLLKWRSYAKAKHYRRK